MRISDWSSDVCSSDLANIFIDHVRIVGGDLHHRALYKTDVCYHRLICALTVGLGIEIAIAHRPILDDSGNFRSEEHTSELQSLMRISYAVFCLKKRNTQHTSPNQRHLPYATSSHRTDNVYNTINRT